MAETQQALTHTVLNRPVAGAIELKTSGGLVPRNAGEAMEIAKMMAFSGCAVRGHFRKNPGACLAVAIQAWEWGMNPFAVANKSYIVNDQIAYESALYNAVATLRAPIDGRLQICYEGEGPSRQCKITAQLKESAGGGDVEYVSPQFSQINPKNSPLWKNDPDQQLCYFSVRAFVRRHFPDVMMGVYTVDELEDIAEPVVQQGGRRKFGPPKVVSDTPAGFGEMAFAAEDAPETTTEKPDAPAEQSEADPPKTQIDEETGEETLVDEAPKPQGTRRKFGP